MSTSTQEKFLKISVITVVRNDAPGLEKTIASVAALDYPALEYIVIDGASTDNTIQVIRRNLGHITHWRTEPDAGLYDAMNKGRILATGDFVFFLNAGDVFASRNVLRLMLRAPIAQDTIIHGNVNLAYRHHRWTVPATTAAGHLNPGYLPHHQTIFYPRSFYSTESYDLFFRVMGDVDFTSRAVRRFPKEYRNVDVVRTTLGGFTFRMCSTWAGIRQMIFERNELLRRYHPRPTKARKMAASLSLYTKGLSVMVGGIPLAILLMRWKHRFAAFLFRNRAKVSRFLRKREAL